MVRIIGLISLIITCLVGCTTMAPKYSRPASPVPAAWPSGPSYLAPPAKPSDKLATNVPWRDFFVNQNLQQLIALALDNNRNLRVAALNIEKARAQYQIQRSDLFPKINAAGNADMTRLPADVSGTGVDGTLHQYTLGLGFSSYELDLFGRIRSLKDQALEQFFATEQARRSVQISLTAEVADIYLILAADCERLNLAKETLVSQRASYELIRKRFEAGISSALDVNQAQTSVDVARVDIARYTTQAAQDKNALDLVVGLPVPADLLPIGLTESLTVLKDVSPGLPSQVLLRRPDILQAENLLKGANANIGAARAAFFPRITLISALGTTSAELTGLFKPGSFTWTFAPQISLPIFDGGLNQANLKAAEVGRDIAVAEYERAIQNAFREVADALAERGTIDDHVAARVSLANATSESYRLSRARYQKGADSYLVVLDSQRSLYTAQQNLITARLARLINLVIIYKVLGGGEEPTEKQESNALNKVPVVD
ncbi:MAG: efflux transporter outer membrane subunit [Deltaproteobacteria bacterium]|nr:efflux transporter outer membrane subunit [Deltaproteobacteria bacterium]